ncbi:MAG: 5-amino-6-(D-ribitylamino)uracil--L-tyrosine 4-hydroxyphenyl transferase CofH [Candidatus Thorarchaeota archaeon]
MPTTVASQEFSGQALQDTLDKALEGHGLPRQDAAKLLRLKGVNDIFKLLNTANTLRKNLVGNTGTFVINRNLNFTNYCFNNCSFCSFQASPSDPRGFLLSSSQIREKVEASVEYGCTEICIQGGISNAVSIGTYEEILQICHDVNPELHPHAFSPEEINHAAKTANLTIVETLKRLKAAGLKSIPGTAAEILVDSVREKICPNKISTAKWITIITQAHKMGIPTTATMMYGHLETIDDIIEHFSIIRDIQEETGGFTEFVPLTFIHPNTRLYQQGARPGASSLMDSKVHAVARLFFGDLLPNLQASWVKLGPKFAEFLLSAGGANDVGGTLLEESISSTAGGIYGQEMPHSELISLIRNAGLKPARRDTLYNILESY